MSNDSMSNIYISSQKASFIITKKIGKKVDNVTM
jgi:hypothetical protein